MGKNKIIIFVALLVSMGCMQAKAGSVDLKRHYYQERSEDATLPISVRGDYLDSLLAITKNREQRKNILLDKVKIYHDAGLAGRTLNDCEELLRDIGQYSVPEQCLILYSGAQAYFDNSDYSRSISTARRLIELNKPDSLKYYNILAHIKQCNTYNRLQLLNLSAKHINEALAELDKTKKFYPTFRTNELKARISGIKSTLYILKGDYEKAFTEFKIAESCTSNLHIRTGININRALIYTNLKEYAIAENYYKKILADNPVLHYFNGLAVNNYMNLLIAQGKNQDAVDLFLKYRQYVDLLKGDLITGLIYCSLGQAYANLGDYRMAYTNLQAAAQMTDSVTRKDREVLIQARDIEREEAKKTQEQYERRAGIAMATAAGIALLCVLCAVVILLLLKKIKKAKKKNSSISARLASIEEEYKGAFKETEETLESKNRELTSLAMQISQISEAIKASLKLLSDKSASGDEKIRTVSRELKKVDMHDDVWKTFEKYFGQTHQRFIHNLCAAHPDLTNGEIRMCTFIILNLTTKDIAAITNRGIRAIDTAKYRLHKKLGCEESTYIYLQQFL